MEQYNVPHGASHFVSIDAPQQGATVDSELQDFIKNPPVGADPPEPANLTSMAGKQLLTYSAYDGSNPSLHTRFFDALNALNGDGYPHQTENVGVAFSTSSPNPDAGLQWMRIRMPVHPDELLYIQRRSPEAKAGSYLPEEATAFFGRALWGRFGWELDRSADPTFIPHDSALDIVGGQSKFDGNPIVPSVSRHHNFLDPDLVGPILARIGFPPPPFTVTISGPSSLVPGQTGAWDANPTGSGAASYRWETRPVYPDDGCGDPGDPTLHGGGSLGDGGGTINGLPCGSSQPWSFAGSARTLSAAMPTGALSLSLRVQAMRGAESDWGYHTVASTAPRLAGTDARTGGEDGTAEPAAEGEASGEAMAASAGAPPLRFALEGARPNPFRRATAVRFTLPALAEARLAVYDALGREVALLVDGPLEAGRHEAAFDPAGAGLPSGVYVVRLAAGTQVATARVTLLR
jgi:hypothetical protein